MDDEIGLVNMNARIYDPVIGRFLSPDPLIPTATDLQSYNRYSYVRNNPLSFTDPSGFAREDHIRHARGNSSHLLRFPGNSGFLNTNTGKFYQRTSRWVSPAETGHGQGSGYWKYGVREVTDPGQKKAIAVHLQVGSEIVQNYGGLSRGNSKETRNRYRALAASELAANGRTSVYQDHLDRAYAADQIYKHLKRKGGWRKYAKIGAIAIVTQGVGAAAGPAAAGAFSGALSGDPKAALIGALSGGANLGISGLELGRVADTVARSTVGGIASELNGGDFLDGFKTVAVTTGANHLYEHVVNYGIDINPGGAAAKKPNRLDPPVQFKNNVGCVSSDPCVLLGWNLTEGSTTSKILNSIPGVNAVAGLHDHFQIGLEKFGGRLSRTIFNAPGMPIAAGITALGAVAPIAPSIVLYEPDE